MSPEFVIVDGRRRRAAFGRKLLFVFSHLAAAGSFAPLKRLFDICVAAMGLTLASPLLLWIVLRVWFSGKPLLTRAPRVGKQGRRYTQYSLAGFDSHPSLQHLPMLLNILAGDMSLIGPRSLGPGDPLLNVHGRARLAVKPGAICSWWLRKRGNIDFDDEAAADREYLNTATLAGDFGIALRAIPALAFSESREAGPRTVDVLGIRIDNLSMAEALSWIRERLVGEKPGIKGGAVVYMTNAHCANLSCRSAAYHQALLASDLNLADGIGVRLAGKLKRTPIRQNVNGTDLFPRLCAMLSENGKSVYLLGGRPGIARSVAAWIATHHPGTAIAGYRDGFFKPHDEEDVAGEIRRSGASVLLVAMGVPNQELWIQRNIAKTGVQVALGVGGLFDFYSGKIPRAPAWMREIGLEWIYRLLQEPGRMWKRYLLGNWTFLARFLFYEMKIYRPHDRIAPPPHGVRS